MQRLPASNVISLIVLSQGEIWPCTTGGSKAGDIEGDGGRESHDKS